jgi:hypothetical protein
VLTNYRLHRFLLTIRDYFRPNRTTPFQHSHNDGVAPFSLCILSNSSGRRTPTRVAEGHADSHDEYGMGLCRRICKLLKMQGEMCSSWRGMACCCNEDTLCPDTPFSPRVRESRGHLGGLLQVRVHRRSAHFTRRPAGCLYAHQDRHGRESEGVVHLGSPDERRFGTAPALGGRVQFDRPAMEPGRTRLAFLSNRNTAQASQIWILRMDDGEAQHVSRYWNAFPES